MNNKHLIVPIILVVIIIIFMVSVEARLEKIEIVVSKQSRINVQNNFFIQLNSIKNINIENVQGNGNAFGNNNTIKNNIANV